MGLDGQRIGVGRRKVERGLEKGLKGVWLTLVGGPGVHDGVMALLIGWWTEACGDLGR